MDRVIRWRIIIKEYVPDIECIQVNKNIVVYSLSRFTVNGNQ